MTNTVNSSRRCPMGCETPSRGGSRRTMLFTMFLLNVGSTESFQMAAPPSLRPAGFQSSSSSASSAALPRPLSTRFPESTRRISSPRTSVAASALAQPSVAERNVEGQRILRKKGHGSQFMTDTMLNHDILTKQREQELGRAIQASKALEQPLEALLQRQRVERIESLSTLHAADAELLEEAMQDEDMLHLAVYGGGRLQNYEDDDEEEGDYSDGFSLVATDDLRLEQQDRRSLVSSAAGLDEDSSNTVQELQELFHDLDLLTEDDIVNELEVAGGRAELQSILFKGALARDELVRNNFKLVVSIAKKWCRGASGPTGGAFAGSSDRPSLDEVVQEGVLGLHQAADRYDPERGVRFSTYATPWVTNFVRRCFQFAATGFRVPTSYHDIMSKYKSVVMHHLNTKGEVPPIPELAEELGVSLNRLQTVLRMTKSPMSLDAPIHSGAMSQAGKAGSGIITDNAVLSDLLEDGEASPEQRLERSFLRQTLETAMARELSPHERDIVRLRLGLDDGVRRTAREVADDWCGGSLSSYEVRLAEKRAYRKLRSPHALSTYKFLSYLDLVGIDRNAIQMG